MIGCVAVCAVALTACDDSNSVDLPPDSAAPLDEGIKPFTPPEPGQIPTMPAPGSDLKKSSTGG